MKKSYRRRALALILCFVMLLPMFLFDVSATEYSVNSLPTLKRFLTVIRDRYDDVSLYVTCTSYGRASDSPKRQASDISISIGDYYTSGVNIAYYAKARNYYVGYDAADSTDTSGYIFIPENTSADLSDQVVLAYDMSRLAYFQRIFTYYDFNIDDTYVSPNYGDVGVTVDEYIGENFTIYGFPMD